MDKYFGLYFQEMNSSPRELIFSYHLLNRLTSLDSDRSNQECLQSLLEEKEEEVC